MARTTSLSPPDCDRAVGSTVSGDNVALAATHDVNVLSQAENHTLKSDNKNASGGIGLQIGTDGIGFYAEASVGKAMRTATNRLGIEVLIDDFLAKKVRTLCCDTFWGNCNSICINYYAIHVGIKEEIWCNGW